MSRIRVKGIILGLFVVGSACLLAIPVSSEETRPAPPLDRDRIEKRVKEIQPTAKERRFDDIGWVSSIQAAERLAKEKERPVFLFSNVGQMDIGRC
jgi:gas vesicle protein